MPLPTYKDAQAKKAERERKKQDRMPKPWWWLKQHDPIARFTLWLVIITFVIAIVGVLQWCSIKGQLDEMRSSGEQTKKIIEINKELAKAADLSAELSREINRSTSQQAFGSDSQVAATQNIASSVEAIKKEYLRSRH